jgi:hypothetical protein
MTIEGVDKGGGVSGFGVAKEDEKPLSGTGGGAGPGTRAGEGEPSGESIGTEEPELPDGYSSEAAREAAALGTDDDHDLTPALEYGEGDRPRGQTMGEALGSGTGEDVGSGTRSRTPLGSGAGVAKGTSGASAGAASPGGNDAG